MTSHLDVELGEADEALEACQHCQDVIGYGPEGWVPDEEAMSRSRKLIGVRSRRRKGFSLWFTGALTTWTKKSTCNESN